MWDIFLFHFQIGVKFNTCLSNQNPVLQLSLTIM